jgi:hypothetical protein
LVVDGQLPFSNRLASTVNEHDAAGASTAATSANKTPPRRCHDVVVVARSP